MYPYQHVPLRTLGTFPQPAPELPPAKMGSVGSLGLGDWLLLGGGAIVAGVGLNSIYGAVTTRKPNFVGLTLGAVVTIVGVAVVGSEVTKLSA